jgi:hypothetical protein
LLALEGQKKLDYFDYLRQIGILMQTFTASSVFVLVHLHRIYIHETSKRWNKIENTLENSVLKRKEDNRHQNVRKQELSCGVGGGNGSYAASSTDTGPKVCWLYNLYKGCHFGERCVYPHVCSVEGCGKSHPAYKHNDPTNERPRYRQQDAKQSS